MPGWVVGGDEAQYKWVKVECWHGWGSTGWHGYWDMHRGADGNTGKPCIAFHCFYKVHTSWSPAKWCYWYVDLDQVEMVTTGLTQYQLEFQFQRPDALALNYWELNSHYRVPRKLLQPVILEEEEEEEDWDLVG